MSLIRNLLLCGLVVVAVDAEVGVTDGPKGVVVNTRTGKAYVAFPDLGVVQIVDGATGAVKVLETGANVKSLSINPTDGRVYAMNRGPGTVSVIDPTTDAIVATWKADRGSLTAIDPATNKLYVSASTGTDPSVIDLATGASTTIKAGTEGNALSVNAKRNEIYFVGYEDNFLTIVDGASHRPTRVTVPGFHQWESALNESTGMLYLPSPNDDALTVVDTKTRVVSTIGTGRTPMAAAVNEATNRVYVVNYASSDVTAIDGATHRSIATIPVGLWPQQIAVNARTNRIYVVNTHADSVSVIDGARHVAVATVPTGRGPWALAVDPVLDKVYVANRLSDTVTIIDGRTNTVLQPTAQPATKPPQRGPIRLIVLAEPGQTIHQPFVDAVMAWLNAEAKTEGLAIDYIRTTDPINDAYLAAHDAFLQLNYPPYRWTPVAEAAFKKAMEQGTIGWVGFHHASLLGKFDGFEMSPFFHDFMGRIVFKSYIRDFATGTVRVEDTAHPVFAGMPPTFPIENDEWYTYDRSPRPDVRVLANVDEESYVPARTIKMGDHPVIWTNPRFKARNVYFQFGHQAALVGSPHFRRVTLNAIAWAAQRNSDRIRAE